MIDNSIYERDLDRGAYLNALSNAIGWNMGHHAVYLWTLPMFHCNGWCFPWTLAAIAGVNVCLRRVDAANIYAAIAEHGVTHFCCAPIVLNFVINATDEERRQFDHKVKVMTAAASPPPPAAALQRMQEQGFEVTHVYGLTETYGPAIMCAWNPEWNDLAIDDQTVKKGRQGVKYHVLQDLTVMVSETMTPVPADGETMGEVMFHGNIVMKGYLKNAETTADEIIQFCRDKLAHYKCPRDVVFGPLPKTSTGKIQKFKLRDQARAL